MDLGITIFLRHGIFGVVLTSQSHQEKYSQHLTWGKGRYPGVALTRNSKSATVLGLPQRWLGEVNPAEVVASQREFNKWPDTEIHLRCVNRNNYVRSAKKDSELRVVTKMPYSPKFLLWLQQLPLPAASGQSSCSKEEVARLSRVALRTQSGRYLHASGKLVDSIDNATLFAVSFKPGASQKLMFQDEDGQYLTVGTGGVLQIKMGVREPRREEIFAFDTPSIQVRLWAFNKKFACNKHGLTFSTTMGETEEQKGTVYQLEYLGGGRGLNMDAIVSASATPSADSSPAAFGFDGIEEGTQYLTTGLWRLRAQDGCLWQIPASGCADLAPKDCNDPATKFEILYVPSYHEDGDGDGKGKTNPYGGIVIRISDGRSAAVKPLGALGVADRLPDTTGWTPTSPEVLHLLPMVNRTSVAIYSPLACAYLAPTISGGSNARRTSFGASSAVDCTSCVPQQWYLKNLITGAVQFFTINHAQFTASRMEFIMWSNIESLGTTDDKQGGVLITLPPEIDNDWMILCATSQSNLALAASKTGPDEAEDSRGASPETEFVICMTDDKFAFLRSMLFVGGQRKPAYLTANLQGGIKLDGSGVITPGLGKKGLKFWVV
ncbi:hypothetical protein ACTXT7_005582 [Hymenolepis weldensis]